MADPRSNGVPGPGERIPFRRFMEHALYDPESGYYTRRIRDVGRGGDFSTSATLDPLLGRAIARWIGERTRSLGRPADVIEVGAGTGALADTILEALGWRRRRSIRYHIVEISPLLRERQQRRLARRAVRWHDAMTAAIAAAGGSALVVSNELVDAFPVNVYQWNGRDRAWGEVFVEQTPAGSITETIQPPGPTPEPLPEPEPNWTDGQRIEIPWSYREWLSTWLPATRRLRMLTVDYGDTFPAVYERRPAGTLRAYLLHERLTGPGIYQLPGRQDLTADVDFSRLIAWGQTLGLATERLQCQKDFLQAHLTPREIARHSPREPDRRHPATMPAPPATPPALDPLGAGTAFKVLEQRLDRDMEIM